MEGNALSLQITQWIIKSISSIISCISISSHLQNLCWDSKQGSIWTWIDWNNVFIFKWWVRPGQNLNFKELESHFSLSFRFCTQSYLLNQTLLVQTFIFKLRQKQLGNSVWESLINIRPLRILPYKNTYISFTKVWSSCEIWLLKCKIWSSEKFGNSNLESAFRRKWYAYGCLCEHSHQAKG